jgi:tetratricopeptide (TPR) repeat protein
MKQSGQNSKSNSVDTRSVAWFKLAECVARGEKERALAVYRLLAHSLNDTALAAQLEADILLFFNKEDALKKYQQAADYYKNSLDLFKAACVYEHMLTINPQSNKYRQEIIELYQALKMDAKVLAHQACL